MDRLEQSSCGSHARADCVRFLNIAMQADVYSFGVTLWECVERQRPWQGMDSMQLWAMWVADPASVTLPSLTINPAAGEVPSHGCLVTRLVADGVAYHGDSLVLLS